MPHPRLFHLMVLGTAGLDPASRELRVSPKAGQAAWLTARMTQSAFVLAFVATCAACTSSPASPTPHSNDGWGPLAVVNAPPNGDSARMPGVLRVTDQCVMLEPDVGDMILLAWPVNETAWRPETESVVYRRAAGDVIEVRDGDAVVLGGSGEVFSGPEALGTVEEWIARLDWIATPDDTCRSDRSWTIGNLSIGDE